MGEDRFEQIPHLSRREGILSIRQDERAGRRSVDIVCTADAPYAVQRGIGKPDLGFGGHVVDDAQLALREIERVRRTKRLQAQTFALIMHLKQKMEHIAQRKTQTDELQNCADELRLLLTADHGGKRKGEQNYGENGWGDPAALEAEGIEHGKASENRRIDFYMGGEGVGTHKGLLNGSHESDENDSILT